MQLIMTAMPARAQQRRKSVVFRFVSRVDELMRLTAVCVSTVVLTGLARKTVARRTVDVLATSLASAAGLSTPHVGSHCATAQSREQQHE